MLEPALLSQVYETPLGVHVLDGQLVVVPAPGAGRQQHQAPRGHTSANTESDSWTAHLTFDRVGGDPVGPHLPQDTLAIEIRRRVGNGMYEQLILRNYSMAAIDTTLRLEFAADFSDVSEKDRPSVQRGTTTRTWDPASQALTFATIKSAAPSDASAPARSPSVTAAVPSAVGRANQTATRRI